MAKKKFVVGSFKEESVLFPAVKAVRKSGYKIHDVYTPYAVHGLDREMGLRETSIHTAGFIYGILGTATALGCISWILVQDWPLNIGGKPHFALPAWIPITFELTVLFSAVGMTMTFCYLCQLAPFVKKHHFVLRSTDDVFAMVIDCSGKTDPQEVAAFLQANGAVDVHEQMAETGWWFGTYEKQQQLYRDTTVDIA